jgi:hypothetical protein
VASALTNAAGRRAPSRWSHQGRSVHLSRQP